MSLAVIGIPTYKRVAALSRLLDSICELSPPSNLKITVLVADNEGAKGAGRAVCQQAIEQNFPYEIISIGIEERGISAVRNKLLSHAFEALGAEYLAMVDDDEIVTSEWLVELLAMQASCNADLIGGRKLPKFSVEPEPWMVRNDVFYYEPSKTSGPCNRLVSTDNLLITRRFYQNHNKPKFDAAFALTGGGDTEFLHRTKKQGAKLAYSAKALTYEMVPEDRMSYKWAKQRSFRIGIGLARVNMLHEQGIHKRLAQFTKLGAILCVAGFISLILIANPQKRIKYQLMCFKQLGKIEGYRGRVVFPYA